MPSFKSPMDALRYHVSGAIARGTAEPITAIEPASPDDGDIIGFNPASGMLIQWNGDDGEPYECETPEEFGFHNIRTAELDKMIADGWKGEGEPS